MFVMYTILYFILCVLTQSQLSVAYIAYIQELYHLSFHIAAIE